MRVRGLRGVLLVRGKELAQLGKYEFERSPGDAFVNVRAELISIDRFLSRLLGTPTVLVKLDIQKDRARGIQNLSFTDKEVTFTILWAEPQEMTGTHG